MNNIKILQSSKPAVQEPPFNIKLRQINDALHYISQELSNDKKFSEIFKKLRETTQLIEETIRKN